MTTETIEYDIRSIDSNGEVIDVDHYATLAEAKRFLPELCGGIVAWVIEKHKTADEGRESQFTTICFGGDNNALQIGNWNQ